MTRSTASFWDKTAQRYARSPVGDEAAYQRKLEVTRGYLNPQSRVLEIACGTGSTALTLAPCVEHIRATDISANMLEIARRKAREAGVSNVSFEQCAIEDLDEPAESLDAVLAHSILHLLEDRCAAIKLAYRVLKPGGVFVSSTVCIADSKYRLLRPLMPIARLFGLAPPVYFLKASELRRDLTAAGFEIVHDWMPDGKMALFVVAQKPLH